MVSVPWSGRSYSRSCYLNRKKWGNKKQTVYDQRSILSLAGKTVASHARGPGSIPLSELFLFFFFFFLVPYVFLLVGCTKKKMYVKNGTDDSKNGRTKNGKKTRPSRD